jgi:hypothetical protein
MAGRKVYHAVPNKGAWAVKQSGTTISNHTKQATAEAAAVKLAKAAEKAGGTGQAVFHKKDGVIKKEYTYGGDPKKSKG